MADTIHGARLDSPMVGRGPQLKELLSLVDSAVAGEGGAAAIVAAPGLGKSRLLAELKLAAAPSIAWITAQCVSLDERPALDVIDRVLFDLLGLGQLCPQNAFEDALARFVADHAPQDTEAVGDLSAHGHADVQRRAAAVARLIGERARTRPLALTIEDVHASDAPALALLGDLFRLLADVPLLVLVTTDEATLAIGPALAAATQVSLEPLDRLGSQILAASLLELDSLPRETRDRMLEQAAGNPFFIEQVIRLLIATDALRLVAGHWRSTDTIAQAALPDTLHDVVLARIDLLPPDARRVLSLLSCMDGHVSPASLEPIAAVAGLGVDITAVLVSLEAADLLEPVEMEPGPAYRFSHALIREAAQGTLPPHERSAWRDLLPAATPLR
jgi:adenylate cyclase